MGLGEGLLALGRDGKWSFRPTYDSPASGLPIPHALDALTDLEQGPLQGHPTDGARPLEPREIRSMLRVASCIPCHSGYEDPVYRDFQRSLERFRADPGLPCRSQWEGRLW